MELAAGAAFFTDNDDFSAGNKREQNPICSAQGGLIHDLSWGIWLAVNGIYYTGGRATVNGVQRNDLQQNSRASLTVAFSVDWHNFVKISANTGVSMRTGADYNGYSIAWRYRWGGGL